MPVEDPKSGVTPPASAVATSSFDFNKLRLDQNFQNTAGVKRALVTVLVRKPHRQEFFRVHPDEAYQFSACVLELKDERETYLVDRSLWEELGDELSPRMLHIAITRQGDVFVYPVRLPKVDGRIDAWSQSAAQGVALAKTRWVRLASNMKAGIYDVWEATATIPEPEWPDVQPEQIFEMAFRDRIITTADHAVVRRLRGLE